MNIFDQVVDARQKLTVLLNTAEKEAKKLITSTKILKKQQTDKGLSLIIEYNGLQYKAYAIKSEFQNTWKVVLNGKVVNPAFSSSTISALRIAIALDDVSTDKGFKYDQRTY